MNRILILTVISLLFYSCTKEEYDNDESWGGKPIANQFISFDEALSIAQEAGLMFHRDVDTQNHTLTSRKTLPTKLISNKDFNVICYHKKNNIIDNDTLLYVFNYENKNGFAIISASKSTEGLLAITESGCYDELSNNDYLEYYIVLAKNYVIRSHGDGGMEPLIPVYTSDTTITEVEPLISVKWGQEYPEGIYCPNGLSGCVNTAMAQILSYYEYPQDIDLTYDNAGINNQLLYWTEIKKHVYYFPIIPFGGHLYCTANDSAHHALGRLCRQLGEMNNSIYEDSGTSTLTMFYVKPTFQSLGYNCNDWTRYNNGMSKLFLDEGHPLFFRGEDSLNGGHAWVVDGYKKLDIRRTYFTGEIQYRTLFFNHLNWGWNGAMNGYYLDNVFDTSRYYTLDPSPYSGGETYNYDCYVNFIVPTL